jgi:hypothetical protein
MDLHLAAMRRRRRCLVVISVPIRCSSFWGTAKFRVQVRV